MNIERKNIDEVNATLTMQIEKADYQEGVEKTLRDYRKKANIPGFRAGMVPMSYIKKMYGKAVTAEEMNKVVSDSLFKYIQDNNLQVLGDPLPNEDEKSDIDFDSDKPIKLVFDIALAPEFNAELNGRNTLTQYEIQIDDKMMENAVSQYTSRFGSYDNVDKAEENDILKGSIVELENGKVKENGIKNEAAVVSPKFIKNADQKKIFAGVKKGAAVVFNPKKVMETENEITSLLKIAKDKVAEADKDFQFTVNEITRFKEAELNQDLFDKAFGKDVVKSEDEFKNKLKEDLKASLAIDSDYKLMMDARAAVLKKMEDLKFPDAFLKRWVKTTKNTAEHKLTDEEIEKQYPAMIEGLKWQLAKEQIAKKNNIKVEEADMLTFGKKVARAQFAQYGMMSVPDNVAENYAKSMLKDKEAAKNMFERVMDEKVIDAIKKAVKLTPKEISLDEFNKMVGE